MACYNSSICFLFLSGVEPAFMELPGSIPAIWDTTIVTDGKVGDYILAARKKGNDWFVGAMTDGTARDLSVDPSFLDEGKYEATICEDGINADRYPSDYKISKRLMTKGDSLHIKMAPGGRYIIRLPKK